MFNINPNTKAKLEPKIVTKTANIYKAKKKFKQKIDNNPKAETHHKGKIKLHKNKKKKKRIVQRGKH